MNNRGPNVRKGGMMSDEQKAMIEPLSGEQKLELAACYAEYCGVDPDDLEEWRSEMVGAKKFVRELMAIWKSRSKKR